VARGERLSAEILAGPPRRGWAIEARLYAEDPDQGYLPSAGRLLAWAVPEEEGLRIDAGVAIGSAVGVHYDPMLAKVVAWGEDREQARLRLIGALERLVVLGVQTSRAWLIRVLDHPAFAEARLHTRFLDEHAGELGAPDEAGALAEAAAAAVVARAEAARARQSFLPSVSPGWRNNRWRDGETELVAGEQRRVVRWRPVGRDAWAIDGAEVRVLGRDPLLLERDGLARRYPVALDGDRTWVHLPRWTACFREAPRWPAPRLAEAAGAGAVLAPMPGRVVAVAVAVGAAVAAGEPLLVLEAMKMEQALRAPVAARVVAVRVAAGDQVEMGALLVELAEAKDGG
jgi:acetyl/propionyl-CoA carboxylase alpha subunit